MRKDHKRLVGMDKCVFFCQKEFLSKTSYDDIFLHNRKNIDHPKAQSKIPAYLCKGERKWVRCTLCCSRQCKTVYDPDTKIINREKWSRQLYSCDDFD